MSFQTIVIWLALLCANVTYGKKSLKAHVHGQAELQIALEKKNEMVVQLVAPIVDIYGKIPSPEDDEKVKKEIEKKILKNPLELIGLHKGLKCKLGKNQVKVEWHESKIPKKKDNNQHHHDHGHKGGSKHAEVKVMLAYLCNPQQTITGLKPNLIKAFPKIKKINVKALSSSGAKVFSLTKDGQEIIF